MCFQAYRSKASCVQTANLGDPLPPSVTETDDDADADEEVYDEDVSMFGLWDL